MRVKALRWAQLSELWPHRCGTIWKGIRHNVPYPTIKASRSSFPCPGWSWLQLCTSCLLQPPRQHHDSIHFPQLLCAGPSCDVCNNATSWDGLAAVLIGPGRCYSLYAPFGFHSSCYWTKFHSVPCLLSSPSRRTNTISSDWAFPTTPLQSLPNPLTPLGDFPSKSSLVHSLPEDTFAPSDYDTEENLKSYIMHLLEINSILWGESVNQRQPENALKYTWVRSLRKSMRGSSLRLCKVHGMLYSRHFMWNLTPK